MNPAKRLERLVSYTASYLISYLKVCEQVSSPLANIWKQECQCVFPPHKSKNIRPLTARAMVGIPEVILSQRTFQR